MSPEISQSIFSQSAEANHLKLEYIFHGLAAYFYIRVCFIDFKYVIFSASIIAYVSNRHLIYNLLEDLCLLLLPCSD